MSLDEMILEKVSTAITAAVTSTLEQIERSHSAPEIMNTEDLAAYMQITREAALCLVRVPGFPMFKIGRRIKVPKQELIKWQAAQAAVKACIELEGMTPEAAAWLHNISAQSAQGQ